MPNQKSEILDRHVTLTSLLDDRDIKAEELNDLWNVYFELRDLGRCTSSLNLTHQLQSMLEQKMTDQCRCIVSLRDELKRIDSDITDLRSV